MTTRHADDSAESRERTLEHLRGALSGAHRETCSPRATEMLTAANIAGDSATVIFHRRYGRPEHRGMRAVVLARGTGTWSIVAHTFQPDPGAVVPPDMQGTPGTVEIREKRTPTRPPISDFDPIKRSAEKRVADSLPLGGLNHAPSGSGLTWEILCDGDHRRVAQCDNMHDAAKVCRALGAGHHVWTHRAGTIGYEDSTPWRPFRV